ncbi:tetratricopeptide repeat protein [bacterium]|nr:MAG: tetratricopeptide repeat protein [bacterium]
MRSVLLLALFAAGCGADLDFKQARHLEDAGEAVRAIAEYDKFLAKHPKDPRVPEASFRSGKLYSEALGRCPEATDRFETAARSSGPWAEPARQALMTCPDYFPIMKGAKWTYVDTLSGGANMRLETAVINATGTTAGLVTGKFYAGAEAFRDYRRRYEVSGWTVWEFEDGVKSPILRWPYVKGRSWDAEKPQGPVVYTVESDDAKVKVKGGAYTGCLKVRSQVKGFDSWVYDYYCPQVGRVKTTVGVPGAENPNTELAKFQRGG